MVRIKAQGTYKNFSTEVVGNKILLFGPNGGGKSTFIHLVLRALYEGLELGSTRNWDFLKSPGELGSEWEVVVELDGGGVVTCMYSVGRIKCEGPRRRLGVGYVGPCDAVSTRLGDPLDLCKGTVEIKDPSLAEYLEENWNVTTVDKVYGDKAKQGDIWIEMRDLAYGYKRALGIVATSYDVDLLAIEAFEAGLHYDLATTLIKFLSKIRAWVLMETHLAITVKTALVEGWSVYYVYDGGFSRVSSLDDLRRVAEVELSV
ncbi:hypothetical protein P186_0874 [Pyrobaculum ferrireducens]|uniref:Rad50/SbcC-type AAA domain-containing protein n=1 Tax=Pyrobaculum ferrireducens TaxID=1104324 RepID=G7VB05_9CREN|nr:hypothetical protein P186_0874 [Pyrobaculum ferrireducens]